MHSQDTLSDAVLLCIRDALGADLPAHVALSQSCRRLRDFYRKHTSDEFWQFACFRAGFGRPKRRQASADSASVPSWQHIALAVVNHARHSACQIRTCMEANKDFGEQYRKSTRLAILDQPNEKTRFHSLYYYLHFNPVPATPERKSPSFRGLPRYPDALSILSTHLPTFPESKCLQYGPLCLHPNASCAFATFPPTKSITFYDEYGYPYLKVENSDGCTVLDVNRGLADIVPKNSAFFQEAANHYYNIQLTSGLSLTEFANLVRQDRGFLGDHEYPYLDELAALT